jgi:DNA repair protein RadA/Sms
MLVAVARRQLALPFHEHDLFVNVAGGIRISEPAADLGIAAALVSSMKEKAFPAATAIFGEIGLTGELRAVGRTELRVSEAARLGFSACILPETHLSSVPDGIEILQASDLRSAIELAGLYGI